MGWFNKIVRKIAGFFGIGSRPQHAPVGPSPEQVALYNQQLADLQRVRGEVEALRTEMEAKRRRTDEDMKKREEVMQQREEELQRREEEAAREAEEQRRQEEEARNYPLQPYQVNSNWEGTMNVGLVGNSGVGKSLLSNAIRGVKRGEQGWAPVGVEETTQEPTMYSYPDQAQARLWDLPGAGTPKHPRETYLREVGLRHYDAILVVTAGRFTETEQLLIAELRQYQVPFFAVRTKLDVDIDNNEQDNGMSPEATKGAIADDLRQRGIADPYLINTRARAEHDFPKLDRDLHAAVAANRKVA